MHQGVTELIIGVRFNMFNGAWVFGVWFWCVEHIIY